MVGIACCAASAMSCSRRFAKNGSLPTRSAPTRFCTMAVNAVSMSPAVVAVRRMSCSPMACAAFCNSAGCAGTVLDDELLAERKRESLRNRSAHRVHTAAWRVRHDQCDGTRRICLRVCRERPRHYCAAEQPHELASSWVGHGLLPGTRCASLPQAQDAPEAPAGPWDRRWTPPGRAATTPLGHQTA